MKVILSLILALLAPLVVAQESATDKALRLVNDIRKQAGLQRLTANPHLTRASQGHADYLYRNKITDHYQKPGLPGFTGQGPLDRALAAGYPLKQVSENLSVGQKTILESVEGLMSAVYHRLLFLEPGVNEMGAGVAGQGTDDASYTYLMGNRDLRAFCDGKESTEARRLRGVCSPDKAISAQGFRGLKAKIAQAGPRLIVWPQPAARGVVPVFFEETPDPLPDRGVSGYPVTAQFNVNKYGPVEVTTFKIYPDQEGAASLASRMLDKRTDPNRELTDGQYVLFPLQRLDWGKTYRVVLKYKQAGKAHSKTWRFSTRTPGGRWYKVNGVGERIAVRNGQNVTVYVVPTERQHRLSNINTRYIDGMSVKLSFFDGNTLRVRVYGRKGQTAQINLGQGRSFEMVVQ